LPLSSPPSDKIGQYSYRSQVLFLIRYLLIYFLKGKGSGGAALHASGNFPFGQAVDAEIAFRDDVSCQVRLDRSERAGDGAGSAADALELASEHDAVLHFFHRLVGARFDAGRLFAVEAVKRQLGIRLKLAVSQKGLNAVPVRARRGAAPASAAEVKI
jgi:hypothetical protein